MQAQKHDSLWMKRVKAHEHNFNLTSADYYNVEGKEMLDKIHNLLKSRGIKECFLCGLNLARHVED